MTDIINPFEMLLERALKQEQLTQELKALVLKYMPSITSRDWLTLEELQDYVPGRPAKSTIYCWVSQKRIPFFKSGKRLRFNKLVIDDWLKNGYQEPQGDPSNLFRKRKDVPEI